jgi:hypothetical protein
MAAEGQAKRKAAEKAPNATPASKRPKTMASTEPNSPSSSWSIYQATAMRTEEEEAAHRDAETIILDSDVDNQAEEKSNEDPSESSDGELSRYLQNEQANANIRCSKTHERLDITNLRVF